jgi:uncharacterized membrane protein
MYNFVNSALGWFHQASAALALVAGSVVLAARKGIKQHKKVGYIYAASMVLVCGSALGIYRLTGSFGMLHVASIIGFFTLAGFMAPMFVARYKKVPGGAPLVHVVLRIGPVCRTFARAECPYPGTAILQDGRDRRRRCISDRHPVHSQKRENAIEVFRLAK